MEVEKALFVLKHHTQSSAYNIEKLLRSAISNWQAANPDARMEDSGLFIKTIFVDGGRMLKRIQPAPQGRAHRIRKRSNHITLVLDSKNFSN
jgi:large subunit ribosomal protein L22